MYTGFWRGNLRERDHLEDTRSRSSGSGMCGHGLDRAGSGYGQVAGTCECGDEPPGAKKVGGGNFLTS